MAEVQTEAPSADERFMDEARSLMSQQLWCWGRDVLRPAGNWLIEIGFQRTEPPRHLENCPSIYTLEQPQGRSIVLRGFGVFYGHPQWGGIFLTRREFRPLYTPMARLEKPPWTLPDLPALNPPSDSERHGYEQLTLALIDWMLAYEAQVIERLGIEYRRSTLIDWDNGHRAVTPAKEIVTSWQALKDHVAATFETSIPSPVS